METESALPQFDPEAISAALAKAAEALKPLIEAINEAWQKVLQTIRDFLNSDEFKAFIKMIRPILREYHRQETKQRYSMLFRKYHKRNTKPFHCRN